MIASSAIATLTVSDATLKHDPLLQLVVGVVSPLQLTLNKSKKLKFGLELLSGLKLSHRNSIIRCLCVHNALDGAPYYLLGGHAMPSSTSPHRSISLASLTSWMTLADEVKKVNNDSMEDILEQLNSHLRTRSFLIESPSLTIADVDLAVALVCSNLFEDIPSYPNVHRWVVSLQEILKLRHGISLSPKYVVTSITNSHGLSVFFYGDETNVTIPKVATSTSATKNSEKGNQQKKVTKQQKNQSSKMAGENQPKQQQPAATATTFDVSALDIRVGKIIKVWEHADAEKLFCEEIDVGEDTPRQIASGLRPFYKTSDLEGRRVVVLCNLKKRNLVGFPSHGMVLCASNADHTAVECMEPPEDAPLGQRVMFEGYTKGDPEPENKIAKKKIFEKIAPDLKTDASGICVWKGAVSNPKIKTSTSMSDAQVS
mmetsp:Transcript_41974/g.48485  ORF Transcript_41974/g.48485 Transcript_41974/m.48485 type:complete len:428 (-) Transcript_41974:85-1368(-)